MNSHEAETALLVLADPIVWQCKQYAGGQQYWQGAYQGAEYKLDTPVKPGEPDTQARNRLWCILLQPNDLFSHAATLEAAKELCQRHALTGDATELEAIERPLDVEGAWYRDEEMKAVIALAGCESPLLEWQPVENSAFTPRHFAAQGKRGNYEVRWEQDRRWVVTFTHGVVKRRMPAEEQCFVTRKAAKRACSVHDINGHWVGTLDNLPGDAIKALWFDSGSVWHQEKIG